MFEEDVKNIQYHTCYANYRKRKEELNLKQYSHSSSANFFPNNGSHVACLHLAVQKVPRQLMLQCHMKKVAFFVAKLNVAEIFRNPTSIKAVPFQLHDCRDTLGAETLAIFAKV